MNRGARGVAVRIPAGTYKLTRMVEIFQSNVVLRGDGVSELAFLLSGAWRAAGRSCRPLRCCAAQMLSLRIGEGLDTTLLPPAPCPPPPGGPHHALLPAGPQGGVRQQDGLGLHGRLPRVSVWCCLC